MALSFAIKLTDQVSPEATKAAGSLQKLHAAIQQEGSALRALESQMKAVGRASSVDIDVGRRLAAGIAERKSRLAELTSELVRQGGAGFQASKTGAAGASAAAQAAESAMGRLAQSSGAAGGALAKLGPYGVAAAAALGLVAVAAGAAYLATSKFVSLSINASEAKGDTVRSLELLYKSEKEALYTYRVLESLTDDVAISQQRVMDLSNNLIKAGQVNGDAMVRSIKAIGQAEAVRKDAGKTLEGVITRATSNRMFSISRAELRQVGLSYRDLAQEIARGTGMSAREAELRLRTGGVHVKAGLDALTKVVDSKMGDLANKKFQTVGVQTERLKQNFARMFEGVDGSAFARVLQKVADLLNESSVTGSALRTVIKGAFDQISSAVDVALPYVQAFFEGSILLALKLYNALYPVRQAIAKLFGGDQSKGLEGFQDSVIKFADRAGAAFSIAAGAVAFLINNIKTLGKASEFALMLVPDIPGSKAALSALSAILDAQKPATTKSGNAVAHGAADGIRAGTPAVEQAMADMGKAATAAFDRSMLIQSPSKVMRLRGRFVDEGLAQGVNDNAQAPQRAMTSVGQQMADVPMAPAKRSGATITGQSPDGKVVHVEFHSGAIVIQGTGNAAQDIEALRDPLTNLMADVFERAAKQQGA